MVAGGAVKAGKIVGHQVHLIHQGGEAFAIHGVNQALVGAQGHGKNVFLAGGFLTAVQAGAEQRHQGQIVFPVVLAVFQAAHAAAGIFPVQINAAKAMLVHKLQHALRQLFPALGGGGGVGKTLCAPSAHDKHAGDMGMTF